MPQVNRISACGLGVFLTCQAKRLLSKFLSE